MKKELLKGLTDEQIEKASHCKSPEELLSLAKKEGVEKENGRFTWKELWRTFKGSWVFWLRSSSVSGLLRRLLACALMWHVI